MADGDRLAAACARLAREKGWPDEDRERLADLLADEERRRGLYDHPRRMEFVGRALAEMLGENGGTAASDPDEIEVRAVAPMADRQHCPAIRHRACPRFTAIDAAGGWSGRRVGVCGPFSRPHGGSTLSAH